MQKHILNCESDQPRLDQYIATQLPDLSRSRIQTLIKKGHVSIDHKTCTKKNQSLFSGNEITVEIPAATKTAYRPIDLNLEIIYEDSDVVAINKPAHISVHPRDAEDPEPTIVNGLLHHCGDTLSGIGGELRPGIVHRLDKETSGIMIVAKNDNAHQFLSQQFADRTVTKTYLTLCNGILKPPKGRIEAAIGRNQNKRQQMTVKHPLNPKPAITEYKLIRTLSDNRSSYSYAKINILTGRTHQIRVHLAAINHSVLGDKLYGLKKFNEHFQQKYKLDRQFLHAHQLTITLPNKKRETFTASLDSQLQELLEIIE